MKRPTKEPYKSYGKYRLKLEEYCDHLESELEKVEDNKIDNAIDYYVNEKARAEHWINSNKNISDGMIIRQAEIIKNASLKIEALELAKNN